MSSGNLEQFGAYQKALELFDLVVADTAQFLTDRKLERLVSQQLASVDSVCSNIEEGYGRQSTVEYRRFLIIAPRIPPRNPGTLRTATTLDST